MASASSTIAGYAHGRVPRAVRERQVLDIAERLFAERGYEGTSMDEIARLAGVTKPVIYSIVRGKEELFERTFARAADELFEVVAGAAAASAPGGLEAALQAAGESFFRFVEAHRAAWAMLFTESAGGRHQSYIASVRARQAQLLATMLSARAEERGAHPDPLRIELAANVVNGAAETIAHWWRLHPELSAEEVATQLTVLLLPGLEALVG